MTTEADGERNLQADWRVVAGILLVVGLVVAVSVVGLFFVGYADTDDADIAIDTKDYFLALSDGDEEEACDLTLESFSGSDCERNLAEFFAGSDDLEYEDVDISNIEIADDEEDAEAVVSYTVKLADDEADCEDLLFTYGTNEDDEWRIASAEECPEESALLDFGPAALPEGDLPAEDEAAIEQTVRAYLEAFSSQDSATACSLESEGFQENLPEEQSCEEYYEELLAGLDGLTYEDISVSDIAGSDGQAVASVSYTSVIGGEEQDCEALTYLFINEDGEWLIDGRPNCTDTGVEN